MGDQILGDPFNPSFRRFMNRQSMFVGYSHFDCPNKRRRSLANLMGSSLGAMSVPRSSVGPFLTGGGTMRPP